MVAYLNNQLLTFLIVVVIVDVCLCSAFVIFLVCKVRYQASPKTRSQGHVISVNPRTNNHHRPVEGAYQGQSSYSNAQNVHLSNPQNIEMVSVNGGRTTVCAARSFMNATTSANSRCETCAATANIHNSQNLQFSYRTLLKMETSPANKNPTAVTVHTSPSPAPRWNTLPCRANVTISQMNTSSSPSSEASTMNTEPESDHELPPSYEEAVDPTYYDPVNVDIDDDSHSLGGVIVTRGHYGHQFTI